MSLLDRIKTCFDRSVTSDYDGPSNAHPIIKLNALKNIIGDDRQTPSQILLDALSKLSERHSQRTDDQAVLDLRKERLANWALLLAGLQTALASTDQDRSIALQDFRESLIDLARQQPDITAFDIKAKSKILPTDDLWARARVLAAYDLFPDERGKTLQEGASLLGKTPSEYRRLVRKKLCS